MTSVMETRDTEVPAKARRRRFTAEYKQTILREADRCRKPGEIGALLRREGLYSSHLVAWRTAGAKGERAGRSWCIDVPRRHSSRTAHALSPAARRQSAAPDASAIGPFTTRSGPRR